MQVTTDARWKWSKKKQDTINCSRDGVKLEWHQISHTPKYANFFHQDPWIIPSGNGKMSHLLSVNYEEQTLPKKTCAPDNELHLISDTELWRSPSRVLEHWVYSAPRHCSSERSILHKGNKLLKSCCDESSLKEDVCGATGVTDVIKKWWACV